MRLRDDEVRLLTRLADDIDLLVSGGSPAEADDAELAPSAPLPSAPAPADPLADLTGMTGLEWPSSEAVEAPEDPALRRLLPDAYAEDPEASAEFRRYTDAALRAGKRADATVVRQGLASIAVTGERVLDDEQTQAWLRFVTDARLVLASRLGIEKPTDAEELDELEATDPRRMAYAVYEWLLGLLGDLLWAIDAT